MISTNTFLVIYHLSNLLFKSELISLAAVLFQDVSHPGMSLVKEQP